MQTYLATEVEDCFFGVGLGFLVETAHETQQTTQADKTIWKGSLVLDSWLGYANNRSHHAFLF